MEKANRGESFNPNDFQISTGTYDGKNVIWLRFDYNLKFIKILRKHTKDRWSQSQKKWYLISQDQEIA